MAICRHTHHHHRGNTIQLEGTQPAHATCTKLRFQTLSSPPTNTQFRGTKWGCIRHSDDIYYLRVSSSIRCDSEEYLEFNTLNMLLLIVYLSVPAWYGIMLYSIRDKLIQGDHENLSPDDANNTSFRSETFDTSGRSGRSGSLNRSRSLNRSNTLVSQTTRHLVVGQNDVALKVPYAPSVSSRARLQHTSEI